MLKFTPKNVWQLRDRKQIEQFSRKYADFMNTARTERMVISEFEKMLKESGFVDIGRFDGSQDKIYSVNRGKSLVALRLVGKLQDGLNLVVAHIDSPRLISNHSQYSKKKASL